MELQYELINSWPKINIDEYEKKKFMMPFLYGSTYG